MKKEYVPIIREKKVHVPSRTVEEFLADSVESRSTVRIMVKTYRETLLRIFEEFIGRIDADKLVMHDEYNSMRNTVSTFMNDLLDALELSCLAKEALESINSDFDLLFEQSHKSKKAKARNYTKI